MASAIRSCSSDATNLDGHRRLDHSKKIISWAETLSLWQRIAFRDQKAPKFFQRGFNWRFESGQVYRREVTMNLAEVWSPILTCLPFLVNVDLKDFKIPNFQSSNQTRTSDLGRSVLPSLQFRNGQQVKTIHSAVNSAYVYKKDQSVCLESSKRSSAGLLNFVTR